MSQTPLSPSSGGVFPASKQGQGGAIAPELGVELLRQAIDKLKIHLQLKKINAVLKCRLGSPNRPNA
jgi:hypothetical protein